MTMPFRRHRPRTLAAAVAAACGVIAPAAAQDNTAQTITVTANKRPQLLTDVPQSVQALTSDKLEAEGVTTLSDLVQVVPGTSQTFRAAPGFEVLQVRGISSGAVGDSLVGYYIDEIPFGLPNVQYIPPVNVFDLSRVEVLRGPQGTLYGQSSMGGAIRMITRKPDLKRLAGEVRLGWGQVDGGFGAEKLDLMLNVPVQTDTFGLRITGGTSKEEGFVADTGTVRNDNLRVKALAQVSPDLSIEGTVWGIRSRQTDYYYGRPASPYQGITDPAEPRGVKTDVNLGNLTVNWSTPVGDLVSATSYMDHQFDYKFSLPGLRNLFPGAGGWLSDNTVKTTSLSQELRLASAPRGSIEWVTGVFFQDAEIKTAQKQGWANYASFGLGPTVWTEGNARLTSRSVGLFGEISRPFMDGRLVPTLGLRLYRDERGATELRDGVASDLSRSFSSANPRFNLAYKPAKGQMWYANIAKGFRSGALQGQSAVNAATAAGLPAERLMPQDSLWSYEGGFKWEPSRAIALEAAVYQIDWKDAQITNLLIGANNTTTTVVTGGTDIRGRGLDFGVNAALPLDGLTLQLAGNLNQTEFTRTPARITAKVGDQIPGSPKKSATVALNYRTELAGLRAFGNLSVNYRGAQTEMITGQASDSIRDVRARVGVGGRNWEASVHGTNLSDQRGVAAVLSAAVVNPIQPRKLGVDLNVKF